MLRIFFLLEQPHSGKPHPTSRIRLQREDLGRCKHPTPVLLPGESRGQRSLVGCSPWGRYKLDTTEQLHFHFSLLCIGGGNGNPLQCSCLENPRDRGAWWTAVYGVAPSRTRLKRLSSSSSVKYNINDATITYNQYKIMNEMLIFKYKEIFYLL